MGFSSCLLSPPQAPAGASQCSELIADGTFLEAGFHGASWVTLWLSVGDKVVLHEQLPPALQEIDFQQVSPLWHLSKLCDPVG